MARSISTPRSSSKPSPTSPSPSASPSARRRSKAASTSVSVNLLPRELAERIRARRVSQYTVGAVMLFVALLGAGYVLRVQDVDRAEQARDEAQAEITRLETAVAELDDYRKLAERLEYGNALLASAMEREIAFARVLGDLAVAFPANASLTSLTFTAAKAEEEVAAAGEIRFGESIGRMEFAGYSVNGYAPGVERVLVDFDRVPAFFNTFLTTAAEAQVADKPVMNFNGSVALDRGAYTNRYADGLPLEETP